MYVKKFSSKRGSKLFLVVFVRPPFAARVQSAVGQMAELTLGRGFHLVTFTAHSKQHSTHTVPVHGAPNTITFCQFLLCQSQAPANWASGKLAPGKLGRYNLKPCKLGPCIKYFSIGDYMSVEFIYWYKKYSANNWVGECAFSRICFLAALVALYLPTSYQIHSFIDSLHYGAIPL